MPARPVNRFCVDLASPGADSQAIGGKARSLLRLGQAGLPVPPAFAVTTELFRALRRGGPLLPATLADGGALARIVEAAAALRAAPWPDGFVEELRARVAALPGAARLSVRSSAETEDDPDALGAGLYTSRVDIRPEDVEGALREVLATALTPAAVAYLGARGRSPDVLPMAALIHPFVAGTAEGTAAQDGTPGSHPIIEARGAVGPVLRDRLEAALATLVATHGPVELEWAATGDAPIFLQLRQYRAGRPRRPAANTSAAEPGWRWDAAHNPLPLSPAQAGLVALVDARCAVPFAQRVRGGYLLYRSREVAPAVNVPDARAALAQLEQLANRRLAAPEPLEQALETFVTIYEPLFAVVQPAARAARDALAKRLRDLGLPAAELLPKLLASVASAATARAALAGDRTRYAAAFGDEAAVWDVAAPTWREDPAALPARGLVSATQTVNPGATAARVRERVPDTEREEWDRLVAAARDAAAVAEDDDALYARAQAHVRRALLAEGERLAASGVLERAGDVFWLPLDVVRGFARGEAALTRAEASRLVTAATEEDARARTTPPRLDEAAAATTAGWLRGRGGSPGACIGIVRHWPVAAGDTPGEPPVIVARTILPTELPLIAAAALVVETGGVLDHVAAQARERGIPAVVGAVGALAALSDGDRVLVDGDAGIVARLGEAL
ncbi:MAG: PEP/pyruvate-binding domain-containing protein [Polyangia bacterium]